MWRIRQIDLYKKVLTNASIQRSFLTNLLGSEQLQIIKKHCEVYRACRDMVRTEKDAPDKALYRKKHQAEYQLHDVTLKELTALGIHKLPSADKL